MRAKVPRSSSQGCSHSVRSQSTATDNERSSEMGTLCLQRQAPKSPNRSAERIAPTVSFSNGTWRRCSRRPLSYFRGLLIQHDANCAEFLQFYRLSQANNLSVSSPRPVTLTTYGPTSLEALRKMALSFSRNRAAFSGPVMRPFARANTLALAFTIA